MSNTFNISIRLYPSRSPDIYNANTNTKLMNTLSDPIERKSKYENPFYQSAHYLDLSQITLVTSKPLRSPVDFHPPGGPTAPSSINNTRASTPVFNVAEQANKPTAPTPRKVGTASMIIFGNQGEDTDRSQP